MLDIGAFLNGLDPNTRASVVSATAVIAGSCFTAIVAVSGYYLSASSTRKISESNANVSRDLKITELNHAAKVRIAQSRIEWIELFRSDASALYAILYEQGIYKAQYEQLRKKTASRADIDTVINEIKKTSFEAAKLKARLLMRIDPGSEIEVEIKLDKILRTPVPSDLSEALMHRKSLRDLTRSILNGEWKRAKTEIEQYTVNSEKK